MHNTSSQSDIMAWETMQMTVYLPLTGISMVAACITIFTAFDTKDIRRSAVQYCTYSVFCCDFVWAFFRCLLYVLGMIEGELPTANKGDRSVTDLNEMVIVFQAILTVAGDLFIVAGAIWIVLSAYEMQRVVTHTITRLEERERHTVLFYDIVVYVPLTVLILLFALGPVSKKDDELTSSCLRASLYIVVWALFLAVLYLPFAMYKIHIVRQNRSGFFDHTLEHIYRRVRILLIVYSFTTIPTSIASLGSEVAQLTQNSTDFLGPHTSTIFFASNCVFYLTGLFNAISIGGSVLCCIRCLRPVMPKELHEDLMHGGVLRASDAMLTSENLLSPPEKQPVFVCTDIESSTLLWSRIPNAMTEAQSLHDDCMRQHLATYSGYEITTAGDAFQLAFHTVAEAISYCVTVQLKLLEVPWPKELEDFRAAKTMTDMFGRAYFRGLRVRMAIHLGGGDLIHQTHPTTGKRTYAGLHELVAREIGDSGLGGQILISVVTKDRYLDEIRDKPRPKKGKPRLAIQFKDFFFREAPSCHIVDLDIVEPMAEIVPYLLRPRFASGRADQMHFFA